MCGEGVTEPVSLLWPGAAGTLLWKALLWGPLGCGRELTLGTADLSMRWLVGALLHQSWLTIHWTNPRQRWDNSVASPDELTGRSDYTASS